MLNFQKLSHAQSHFLNVFRSFLYFKTEKTFSRLKYVKECLFSPVLSGKNEERPTIIFLIRDYATY